MADLDLPPVGLDGLDGIEPATTVALAGASGGPWLAAYRELVDAGAVVLLLDPDAPPAEHRRLLDAAGGGRLAVVDGDRVTLTGAPRSSNHPPGTVLLPSSGTTGAPKLVPRSQDSLRAEGRRHARYARLGADDTLLVPLHLWHAYALGWAHAAFEAQCRIVAVPPTSLGRCAEHIAAGATVLALVPTVARLLAQRRGREVPDNALRMAMVGAGPVDAALEERFAAAFGIGLARNYGSTETGALFSGAPGSPPGCVGYPLDGVEFRVVAPDGADLRPGAQGELLVRVAGEAWHPMGDLASYDPATGLRLLGRRTRAIRRGDRWIAPEEIEAALCRHPDIADARVYPVRHGTSVALQAEVVHVRGPGADVSGLGEHAKALLGSQKVPDRVRCVGEVPRGRVGKPLPPRALALADRDVLIAAATAYKRSELLFALVDLGIVEALGRGATTAPELAARLGLDEAACAELLRTAEEAGLLRPEDPLPAARDGNGDVETALVALEGELSRTWVTREALAEVVRSGVAKRPFDREGPSERLREVYQAAMHGTAAHQRARSGLALARFAPGQRLLEVSGGPGVYHRIAGGGTHAGRGPLPDGVFDLVVLANSIHGPAADLRAVAERVPLGGRLLVDDVFLDTPEGVPPETRLDWLTHGGTAWPTEAAAVTGLAAVGFTVERTLHLGRPACTMLLAVKERS
ncbi:ANL family adenylate-forming protein [Streptomyces sp. NRRL S-350]|uniref:ANL family adenylate-forming protein n=1 Tax=Streptomyces sp. NRRL S-350 TaxID=1463902 RepID=UPI0004C0F4DB|nr:fatty acid--CoA ligase family protein [Streptomyces sp. NRRL S-350]